MGIKSGRAKVDPVYHRTNFEKKYGQTPEDMHAQLAVGRKCHTCPLPGQTILRSLVLESDLPRLNPRVVAALIAARVSMGGAPALPTIATTYGPMVKVNEIAACSQCVAAAERGAAKGPSWVLVEIVHGPSTKRFWQTPGKIAARKV